MKLVIIESPYRGDIPANTAYARQALRDSLDRGEAPIASHLLHTQVLDDTVDKERQIGIEAGIAWLIVADVVAVYYDRGISLGMAKAVEKAIRAGIPVDFRKLPKETTNEMTESKACVHAEIRVVEGEPWGECCDCGIVVDRIGRKPYKKW